MAPTAQVAPRPPPDDHRRRLVAGIVSDGLAPSLGADSLRHALAIMIAAPIAASLLLLLLTASRRLRSV